MQASYDQYMPYLFSRAGAAGVPLAGTFELTCRCNFDCRMCYIHRSQFDASARAAERDAAWWLALARSARDAGMLTLLLTGGEPLLRPDFPEIYTACRNLGLLVSVNTNGTLLTPELVQLLAQTPPQRINLTLYGASRETYAALCGRPEAYDRVLWTIDALQAAGVPLKLNFTETPYNQADAPAVYAFARARGLRVDAVTYCFPPVRARENGACTSERFSPEVSAREQMRYDRFRFGEEGFRAIETDVLRELGAKPDPLLISCGGGIVKRPENLWALHQNGVILFIDRPVDALAVGGGRPLSSSMDALRQMEAQRRPLYLAAADAVIPNNGTLDEALRAAMEALDEIFDS